ncbi:MAG: DUF4402 domain-containing protein [Bacteroidales bacterium]|nr:DUF4402 domain-containing protein [Bacteroidales bacterium]
MDFGTIAVGTSVGTVVLAPDNTGTFSGGASVSSSANGVAASFTVAGRGIGNIAITLPADGTVTLTGAGDQCR